MKIHYQTLLNIALLNQKISKAINTKLMKHRILYTSIASSSFNRRYFFLRASGESFSPQNLMKESPWKYKYWERNFKISENGIYKTAFWQKGDRVL